MSTGEAPSAEKKARVLSDLEAKRNQTIESGGEGLSYQAKGRKSRDNEMKTPDVKVQAVDVVQAPPMYDDGGMSGSGKGPSKNDPRGTFGNGAEAGVSPSQNKAGSQIGAKQSRGNGGKGKGSPTGGQGDHGGAKGGRNGPSGTGNGGSANSAGANDGPGGGSF